METNDKSNVTNKHKDTLFRLYFKEIKNFLHLLEHCGRKNLTPDDIEPFDLESAVAVRVRRNDISFITKDNRIIILVEHQSTINPNMAFRMFLYYFELLQLWVKVNKVNIFGTVKIEDYPLPELYVAYNGTAPLSEKTSNFKIDHEGNKVDLTVNIVDIHYENLNITTPDNALAGYSFFYKVYDECKTAGLSNDEAFKNAREKCIEQGHMKGFIEKEAYIVEYKDFFYLDYDAQLKAEGIAEGEAKGAESTISVAIRSKVPFPIIETMAKEANISQQRLNELMERVAV